MKTRSTRIKEYPPYENVIKKTSAGKYAALFIITGSILATIVSIGTGRPELFYICTIVAIIGSTALFTSVPALNSITIAAFPIYVVVVPLTIIRQFVRAKFAYWKIVDFFNSLVSGTRFFAAINFARST